MNPPLHFIRATLTFAAFRLFDTKVANVVTYHPLEEQWSGKRCPFAIVAEAVAKVLNKPSQVIWLIILLSMCNDNLNRIR